MNKRGNRRGPFHGIGQPHMQRNLGRLPNRADKQQDADQRYRRDFPATSHCAQQINCLPNMCSSVGKHRLILKGSKNHKHQQNSEQEPKVANTVDEEGLRGCRACGGPLIPMANEQIRAQPHGFPKHKQLEEVIGHHEHEHRKREERNVPKKPGVSWITMHIADRVHMNESTDDGHQQ